MHVVLVHGWGFDARIWAPLTGRLQGASTTQVDLGFIAAPSEADHDSILIGHSLGVLWLLKEGGRPCKGLVSIQGFDRFCPHVPAARVAALKRGLDQNPERTLQAFRGSCGAPDYPEGPALNVGRLQQGLDWLMHWDARPARKRLQCPMLILAARDDAIVPPAMTEAVWEKSAVFWSPTGGHVLPLRHPDWCARHVLEFAHSLPS